jgi:uncharacterized protein YlbG (UPF0298 family)
MVMQEENQNIKGEFVIERDEYSWARFGCRIGEQTFFFMPLMDVTPDGIRLGRMAIGYEILYCNNEAVEIIRGIFEKYENVISNYYKVFVEEEWYPLSKSALDSVLTLDLTEEEISIINQKLSEYTYIYLIRDSHTGYTKIGRSDNPFARIQTLKKQDTLLPRPNEFEILFCWADYPHKEKWLHLDFQAKRVRGEWFDLSQEDIAKIQHQHRDEKCLVKGKSLTDEFIESYQRHEVEQALNQTDEDTIN